MGIDDAGLLTILLEEAGALAETWWPPYRGNGAADLTVTSKANPTDLVTAADRAAETHIVQSLARLRPQDGVLGEEGSLRSGGSGRTWVIDPVDGTYNFTRGSRRWCTALALIEGETPVLGGVYPPFLGTSALVVGGPGLWPREGGAPFPPISDRGLATSCLLTYLHPPFHEGPVGAAWRRLASGAGTLRMTGSGSLDALDVAAGRADLLVQHSVPPWDRYPGEAIIRAVGGASATVLTAGVEWYLAGAPAAVREAVERIAHPTAY